MDAQLPLRCKRILRKAFFGALLVMYAQAGAYAQTAPARNPAPSGEDNSRRAVSVESHRQLFAVMCALDAAGFTPGTGAAADTPGRIQLRKHLQALQGPAVIALR